MPYTWSKPETRAVTDADVVFLAHFTGCGINEILDLPVDDYFSFLDVSIDLYKQEFTIPRPVFWVNPN